MYGCIVAQRTLLATKTRPIMFTMRQTRTLYCACSRTCWRRALQTTAPSLHLYRPTPSTDTLAVAHVRYYSSPPQKQSSTQRIKVVLREYGVVAVVFHTVMSLTSLGTCYLIVSRSVYIATVSFQFTRTSFSHTVVLMWVGYWSISMSNLQPLPKEPPHLLWPMSYISCCSPSERESQWLLYPS